MRDLRSSPGAALFPHESSSAMGSRSGGRGPKGGAIRAVARRRATRDGHGAARRRRPAREKLRQTVDEPPRLRPVECPDVSARVSRSYPHRAEDRHDRNAVDEAAIGAERGGAGFARHGVLIGEELVVGTFVPATRTSDEMRKQPKQPRVRSVSPGFMKAMGIRVIGGRELDESRWPGRAAVIVVNQRLAQPLLRHADIPSGRFVDWHRRESSACK